jgi:hypothetical protein
VTLLSDLRRCRTDIAVTRRVSTDRVLALVATPLPRETDAETGQRYAGR